MKKIGILDLGTNIQEHWWLEPHSILELKQYVAVTPQVVSVWCRELGHRVHYATYYGVGDPMARLPDDLDLVFIAAHSHVAPLAYAMSKVYQKRGTRTVLGGPHSKSYPVNSARHFDYVVLECDKSLIADIINDQYDPGSILTSGKPYHDTPTIEERMTEIKSSVFWKGRPTPISIIPILASVGCPYTCNFCMDWNSRYRALPMDRLEQDLKFASEKLPGVTLMFYDPNFGIRFDETLTVFDKVPPKQRSPYALETSLSNLCRGDRLQRLRETNCLAVAPGVESWTHYNDKAGVGKAAGHEKLTKIAEDIEAIRAQVPFIQTNFICGLDTDAGDEPFELTKEFLQRVPYVYPTFNIPMAFHGTPLYDSLFQEGRILKTMPFSFYATPYLTLVLKNYDPIAYFGKMVDLYGMLLSSRLFRMRLAADTSWQVKFINSSRIYGYRRLLASLQHTLQELRRDPQLLAFHRGETSDLPEMYARLYRQKLGKYAECMPISESGPFLDLENSQTFLPSHPNKMATHEFDAAHDPSRRTFTASPDLPVV